MVDHTKNFGLPASAVKAMADAVPDKLVRELVKDGRTPKTFPTTPSETPGFNNFIEQGPLPRPWGLDTFDKQTGQLLPLKKAPPKDAA